MAILPDCDTQAAQLLLNDVRKKFAALNFSAENENFSVTLSAGVCTSTGNNDEDMLVRADKALYQAKNSGRDRVVAAD